MLHDALSRLESVASVSFSRSCDRSGVCVTKENSFDGCLKQCGAKGVG